MGGMSGMSGSHQLLFMTKSDAAYWLAEERNSRRAGSGGVWRGQRRSTLNGVSELGGSRLS